MNMNQYKMKISDYFDYLRNEIDIYIEEKIQYIEFMHKRINLIKTRRVKKLNKNDIENTKMENINKLNKDRDEMLNEIIMAETSNFLNLENLDLIELNNIRSDEHQLGEKLFKIFCFSFILDDCLRIVFIENFFLNKIQISYYQALVGSHNIVSQGQDSLNQQCKEVTDNWWRNLFKNKLKKVIFSLKNKLNNVSNLDL